MGREADRTANMVDVWIKALIVREILRRRMERIAYENAETCAKSACVDDGSRIRMELGNSCI
jgi:hypothetical protein